jgi:hypothetical protein
MAGHEQQAQAMPDNNNDDVGRDGNTAGPDDATGIVWAFGMFIFFYQPTNLFSLFLGSYNG